MSASSSVAAAAFRQTLSRFLSGVTVVSARGPDGGVHGATVSAFMSVSLEPRLVAVCLATTSRLHDHVLKAERIGVSVLADEQEELAMHFAGRFEAPAPRWREECGVPVLDGALAWIVARPDAGHAAGDHRIFVAEVIGVGLGRDAARPLAYFGGSFQHVSAKARPQKSDPVVPWYDQFSATWG